MAMPCASLRPCRGSLLRLRCLRRQCCRHCPRSRPRSRPRPISGPPNMGGMMEGRFHNGTHCLLTRPSYVHKNEKNTLQAQDGLFPSFFRLHSRQQTAGANTNPTTKIDNSWEFSCFASTLAFSSSPSGLSLRAARLINLDDTRAVITGGVATNERLGRVQGYQQEAEMPTSASTIHAAAMNIGMPSDGGGRTPQQVEWLTTLMS